MKNKYILGLVNSHFLILIILCISIFTLIHWFVLLFQIPVLDNLPYWKYKLHITSVNWLWIFLAFISLVLAILLSMSSSSYLIKLIGIILLGTAIQYCFAFSKENALENLNMKMTGQGHAEFAKVAVKSISMRAVAIEYETLLDDKYYQFLPSKPPGTLLFYMLTNQVSEIFLNQGNNRRNLENLATIAIMTWPLLSCLAILPLYFLTRYLFEDPQLGIMAGLFYISTPSLNLITLVTDQTIYPLLSVFSVLLVTFACRKNNLFLAFISGIVFYGVLYFSFGLAVVGFLFLMPIIIAIPSLHPRSYMLMAQYAISIGLGIVVANLTAYFFLNYNFFVRYTGAIAHHLRWKKWENNLETYLSAGFTNLTEFTVWIGLPIALLFLLSLYHTIRQLILRKPDISLPYNLILVAMFIFLLVFGKTKAEVARLWLFLVPFICLSVAYFMNKQAWTTPSKFSLIVFVLFLQMGTTLFTLQYQDY